MLNINNLEEKRIIKIISHIKDHIRNNRDKLSKHELTYFTTLYNEGIHLLSTIQEERMMYNEKRKEMYGAVHTEVYFDESLSEIDYMIRELKRKNIYEGFSR